MPEPSAAKGDQLELVPRPPKLSVCHSCRASIIWTRTERGKKMPLDADPVPAPHQGTVFVLRERESKDGPLAIVAWGLEGAEPHYISHFATCPNAGAHRRTGIASPDAGQRGDGRMGTDPVMFPPGSAGEGSRDGGVKPRSQITELPGETFEDIFR